MNAQTISEQIHARVDRELEKELKDKFNFNNYFGLHSEIETNLWSKQTQQTVAVTVSVHHLLQLLQKHFFDKNIESRRQVAVTKFIQQVENLQTQLDELKS